MSTFVYTPRDRFSAAVNMARCRASVSAGYGGGVYQCGRKVAVTDEGGIGWCKQHDPEAIKRRDAAWNAKMDAKWAADKEQRLRPQRLEALLHRTEALLSLYSDALDSLMMTELRNDIRKELGQ